MVVLLTIFSIYGASDARAYNSRERLVHIRGALCSGTTLEHFRPLSSSKLIYHSQRAKLTINNNIMKDNDSTHLVEADSRRYHKQDTRLVVAA